MSVPSGSITPSDPVPDELTRAPTLSARRAGDRVVFRWRSPIPVEPGDEWVWRRDDTGEAGRTDRRRLVVDAPGQVCVEVRMARGSDSSPSARECVS